MSSNKGESRGGVASRTLRAAAVCIIVLILGPAAAPAFPPPAPDPEKAQVTAGVTISEVAHEYNLIYVSERPFRVLADTPILDREGGRLSLEALRPPLSATITFRLQGRNRHPVVIRIVVAGGK